MYYYRYFVLLTLSSLLIPSNVECGRNPSRKTANPASLSGSSPPSGDTSSQQPAESSSEAQPQTTVPENPLDLNDLKQDYGIIKEAKMDDWNFKFYRSYINKNFNKLKKGSLELWPKTVSESCVFDFMLVYKDKQHLLCLKSINPEGTTGFSHVYFEDDTSTPSNSKKEDLSSQDFFAKFKDLLGTVFVEPYPTDLVKHPLFQQLHYEKKKSLDTTKNQGIKVL